MAESVIFDPTVPPGSESLKQGPSRFQDIERNILKLFGFDGTVIKSWVAPFAIPDLNTGLLTVNGPPVDPLGIATKNFVQQRTTYATIGGNGVLYIGNPDPALTAYEQGVVYVLKCNATNSESTLLLQLDNGLPALDIRLADGVVRPTLPVGTLAAGTTYFVVYDADGTFWRIVGSLTVPNPAPGSLEVGPAVPKNYVDTAVGHPVNTVMPADIAVTSTVTALWTAEITTPNDGNSYLLHADYLVNVGRFASNNTHIFVWLNDGSRTFGGAGGTAVTNDSRLAGLCTGAFSPTVYGPGTVITVTVEGQTPNDKARAIVVSATASGPPSSITLTLFRTST